ncbi:MAG: hypothetical protein C0605_04025 [Hyphomicrobiales bacterium]|nr:MAG: hypothetical protein C0605_04025 [Hyphomicrobiales bacterium]
MSENVQNKRGLIVKGLTALALVLLVVIYFVPVWWVSLTAPNYPAESFPDGVRINFHMNGVFNGCTLQKKTEIEELEALDCVHEMDAINHFVGMYPIASGGVLEKAFSPFLLSMLGVMLIGFMIFNPRLRVIVMSVGFLAICAWMYMTFLSPGGLRYQNSGYLSAMVTVLGLGHEEEGEELSPIIAKLRESLDAGTGISTRKDVMDTVNKSGQAGLSEALTKLHKGTVEGKVKTLKQILAEAKESELSGKALSIQVLKGAFEADQEHKPIAKREQWNGSNWQLLFWHYGKNLGRWFNNPPEIAKLVKIQSLAGKVLLFGLPLVMVVMVFAGRNNGLLHWLLVVVPLALPVIFIVEYASWLWWYGHSMNEMGAFSLKPFMPTVFGVGKVAQFATHSYPSIGFGLISLMSLLLALAALIRRKMLREAASQSA